MPRISRMPNPKTWLRYVVDHPHYVIGFILLITLVFAFQIPGLRIQTSIYDMIIQDLPENARYRAFKEEFGSEEIILVVVKTGNVFDPATFKELERIAGSFSEIEGVKRVISLPGIRKAMDITGKWSLSDFERIILPVDLLKRNLVSEDGKTSVISLILEDLENKDRILNSAEEIIEKEKERFSLYQIGMPVVSRALAHFTEQDFKSLPPITFSLIALVLFLFFRNIRGILIPAGSVLIALIWTFGLMAWTGTPLCMLTMIVPIFLIAVGTAYCMYIFPEYTEAVGKTDSPANASYECFLRLGFPTSLAVVTTTIGLGSLLLNRISAIRQFAFFSCFGILSMLVIMLTLLPAVMALLPLPGKKPQQQMKSNPFFDSFLSGIIRINLKHQKIAISVIALAVLLGIVGITRLRVETNPVGFFKGDTSVSRHFHDVYQDMAGSFPINVVVDSREDDFFENPENLQTIARLQRFLASLEGVDKTVSFIDYLKLVNYATNQYQAQYYALPEEPFEVRMLVNNFKTMLGNDMLERFVSGNFNKVNILLRTHLSSSVDILAAQKRIDEYLRKNLPAKFSSHVTGFGIVISQSSRLLTEGQVKSLGLTLLLVFTIMLLLFMSYKVGLIGMLPNCFPIIVNFGLMGWLGIPLSVATSLIASVAIGLAVDDTIHYLVHYNREFKKDLDKHRALRDTVKRMGKPIVFTTVTVGLGFSILMASSFRPTAVFGLLMVITMFSALIADLVLLPSLMLHVELVTVWDMLRLKLGKDPQKGIPLFNGLSRTQVHYILMAGNLKRFREGEVIFRKGEVSDSMYAVISGEIEVVVVTDETSPEALIGSRQLISRLSAGEVVGEMGMIRSCERSATVIASKPSELLQINDRMINRLHWLYPPTAQRFFFNLMTIVCNRLENLTECYLEVSILDNLSGLHTRDYFMGMLEKEMARCRRYKSPLSIFVMDLDNFKGVNHLYGHLTGDFVLAEVGSLLSRHSRSTDLLCRYEGQRFACMLPNSDDSTCFRVCDRLRELLADHCFDVDSKAVYITASFGLSSMADCEDKTGMDLLQEAMEALGTAKAKGRNRVFKFQVD